MNEDNQKIDETLEEADSKEGEDLRLGDLPVGTDFSELQAGHVDPSEIWIPHGGKRWGPFYRKSVGWSRKSQILTECTSWDEQGASRFNMDRYNKLMMKEALVVPKGFRVEELQLTQLDSDFGDKLQRVLPQPFKVTDMLEVSKND